MLKIISLLLLLLISGNASAEQILEQSADQATTVQSALPSTSDARTLIEQGRDNDAISMLVQLLNNSPDDFQAWFLLGVTQAKQRRFHDAVMSFGKVVSLQPNLAEPHNNLAVIYNELGDFRAAVKELEASLKLKPNYATAHENIGDLYVKLAADAYRKALQEDGEHPALRQRYDRLLHIRTAQQSAVASDGQPVLTAVPKTTAQAAAEQDHTLSDATTVSQSKAVDTTNHQEQENADTNAIHSSVVAAPQAPAISPAVVAEADQKSMANQQDRASKPEPLHAPQVAAAQDDIKTAMAALEAWRSAWNRQDVPSYFTAYSNAFDFGARFKTLKQWKQYKQWVIAKRTFIRVTLENVEAKKLPNGEILLVFLQHFRSDSFNSDDIKEMLLRQTQHGWKIVYEASK